MVCLGTLVQYGLTHMRGVTWRAGPEKLKTGICEMKILGSEVLWCVLGHWLQWFWRKTYLDKVQVAKVLFILLQSPTNFAPRSSTLFFGCNPGVAEYFSMGQNC